MYLVLRIYATLLQYILPCHTQIMMLEEAIFSNEYFTDIWVSSHVIAM